MYSRNDGVLQQTIPEARRVVRYINVDSRDRDRIIYPDTNDYEVTLKTPLFGVQKIQLVSAEIPKSEYFIDETNNTIEVVLDPAAFWSSAPSETSGDTRVVHIAPDTFMVIRVHTSFDGSPGVLFYVTRHTNRTVITPLSIFNSARTSFVDVVRMHANEAECICVATYTESDVGACRVVISSRYASPVASFGSQFAFDTNVKSKRLVALDSRRFAIGYRSNDAEVIMRVASTGVDVDDLATRLTNARAYSRADEVVVEHAIARVDAVRFVVVYVTKSVLANYGVHVCVARTDALTHLTTTGVVQTIKTAPVRIASISCASNVSGRTIIAWVEALNICLVTVAQVYDMTVAVHDSATITSEIDPLARAVWLSDASQSFIVDIETSGDVLINGVADTPLSLLCNERYRFTVRQGIGTELVFYASEHGNERHWVYTLDLVSGTAESIVVDSPSNPTIIFYGTASGIARGRIVVSTPGPSNTVESAFVVCATGQHDVGNISFAWGSDSLADDERSFRRDAPRPGNVGLHAAAAYARGVAYVLSHDGSLWSYDGARWTVCTPAPFERYGACMTVHADVLYVVGGRGRVHTVPFVEHERVTIQQGTGANSVVAHRFRSAAGRAGAPPPRHFFFYYVRADILDDSGSVVETARLLFHSARDPSDVDSLGDWAGATDLSSEFSGVGAIHGMRLTADNPSTLTYAVPTSRLRASAGGATAVVNPAPGTAIGLGLARASVDGYTFSFMAHVVLSSIESSGVLGSLLTDGVALRISARVDDNVVVSERTITVRTGEWTLLALELRDFTGVGTSSGALMDSLRITIEAPAILLCTGYVGVRDVQLLANVAKIDVPGEADVRVEFGAFDEAEASGMTNVFVESEFARPDVARHVTTIRVGGHAARESYLNDVWTLSTDARHGSYDAIVRRNRVADSAGRFGVRNASLNTRGDVDAFVDSSARFVLSRSEASDAQYDSFNGLSALAWPALDDVTGSGGAAVLFDDVESIRFGGLTAIAMPGTGSRVRAVAAGDFAFATSLCPALTFCVILVDCRSANAMLAGASGGVLAPSSVRSAEISALRPTHYNLGLARTQAPFVSGNSMRMTAKTHVQYVDVSGAVAAHTFAAMAYVNASSGSAGERTLLAFPGFITLVLAADWTLRLKRAADGAEYASDNSIASDVWVHISLTASGNTVHVDVNGDRVMDAFASRPQGSFGFHIGSATSLWSGAIVLNSISVHCMSSFGDAGALIARHRSGSANVTDQCVMFAPMSGGELAMYVRSPRSGGATAWSIDGIVGTQTVSVPVPAASLRMSVDVEFTRSNGEVCMCVRDTIGSEIASSRAVNTTSLKLVSGDMTLGAARLVQPGRGFYSRDSNLSVYYAPFAGALDEVRLICGEAHVWTSRDAVGSERRRSMTWRREVVRTAVAEPRWEARAFAACASTAAGVWIYGGKSLCGSCSDHWIATPALSRPEADEPGSTSWPPPRAVLLTHMSGSPVGAAATTSDHPGSREYASMASADDDLFMFGGEVRQHTGPFVVLGSVRRVRLVQGSGEPDDAEFDASPLSGYIYPVYTARHSVLHDHPAVEWIDIEVSGGVTYTLYAEEGVGANVDSRSNPNLTTFDASLHLLEGDAAASMDMWSDQGAHEPVVTAVHTDMWRYETGPGSWSLVDAGTITRPGRLSRGSIVVDGGGAVRLVGGRIVSSLSAPSVESARAAWNETRFLSTNVLTDRVRVWTHGAPPEWTLVGVADSEVRYPPRAAAVPYASGLCSPGGSGGRLCAWPVELAGGLRRVAVLSSSGTVFINQFEGASVEVNAHYAIAVHGNALWYADDSQPPSVSIGARDTLVAESVRVGALRAIPVPGVGTGTVALVCNDDIVMSLTFATSDLTARSAAVPQFDTVSGVTTIDVSELSDGSVGLNGQAITLLRAVWGVVYVCRCGAGIEMDAVVNGVAVASCVPGGSAIVTTTDLGIVGQYDVIIMARRNDGSALLSAPVLRVMSIGTVAALASEVVEATSALRVTRILKAHRASIRSIIPGSAPELVDMCILPTTLPLPGFSMGLVFCDAARARVGTVWFIRSDGSRIFATSGPHDVVASGPSSNFAIGPISSGRCVATWTPASGAGLHASIVAETSGSGSASEVTSAAVSVPLIEPSDEGSWTLMFVYGGTGRVLAQRAVDGSLAQTLLGDAIVFTDSALILSGSGSAVDVAAFASGIRRGDVICVADVDGDLMYQDVGTRDIDPLLSKAAPDLRTVTFSLLERTGFVTSDFADYRVATCDDIVDGLSGSIVSSFVVVFCTVARDAVRCRMFSFESGAYVGDGAVTISTGTGVRLRDVTMGGLGRLIVSWSTAGSHALTTVDVHSLLGSTSGVARVLSTSLVDVDIASPVLEMPGVLYTPGAPPGAVDATNVVFVPVHSSATSEVGVVAVRGIGDLAALGVTRSSTTTRVRAGDYSAIDDFRSELERALRADVDAAFSVTYDSGTTKLSIANSHAAFTGVLDAHGAFPRSTTIASNNGLGYIMGFRDFSDFVGRALDDGSFVAEAPARVDMSGRQYIYMYLSNTTEYFSSEVTSRSARNAFGRIVLAVDKGETMFFMEGAHYVIEADVDVPVLTSLRVQLGRFAQLTSASLRADGDRSISLYAPQGVEHSFCLRVTCRADKSGSGIAKSVAIDLPDFMAARRLEIEAVSEDDGAVSETDSE